MNSSHILTYSRQDHKLYDNARSTEIKLIDGSSIFVEETPEQIDKLLSPTETIKPEEKKTGSSYVTDDDDGTYGHYYGHY